VSILKDDVLKRKLEVDLLTMGIDLLDFYRGKISLRRLCVLASCLDNNSHLMKEIGRRDIGDVVTWSPAEHLACAIANAVRYQCYLTELNLWGKGGSKGERPQPPEPIHPPGYQPPPIRIGSAQELAQLLGG